MSAPVKLTLFGVALLAAFGVAYLAGGLLISPDFVEAWLQQSAGH